MTIWTKNVLSKSFGNSATQSVSFLDSERKILSAARPIANFFRNLGFVESSFENVTAFRRGANGTGRINLYTEPTLSPSAQENQRFDGLILKIALQRDHHPNTHYPTMIHVSLNDKGEGQYRLLEGKSDIVSGDPRQVVIPFVMQMKDSIRDALIPTVNFVYGGHHLKAFKPAFERTLG